MACMCGDTMCPSCGPAQGYSPEESVVEEWLSEILVDLPAAINADWLAAYLSNVFSNFSEDAYSAILKEVARYYAKCEELVEVEVHNHLCPVCHANWECLDAGCREHGDYECWNCAPIKEA